MIARRDRISRKLASLTTPKQYLETYMKACDKCMCPDGENATSLAEDIDFLVGFHGFQNIGPFFEWADKFFGGNLPTRGRPKNCYIIGYPSSGKSTLSDLVVGIIPGNRVFTPVLNSSTPFCNLSNHHMLATCDDWRFTGKVPVTETLQWMEGRSFGVDVKGKDPISIDIGPICLYSANHKKTRGDWTDVDIQAFQDRCYIVSMPHAVHPKDRKPVGDKMTACKFCRIQALAKYCPFIQQLWGWARGSSDI